MPDERWLQMTEAAGWPCSLQIRQLPALEPVLNDDGLGT